MQPLTEAEITVLRKMLEDLASGRRLACFIWKFLAILGGIAVGVSALFANFHMR